MPNTDSLFPAVRELVDRSFWLVSDAHTWGKPPEREQHWHQVCKPNIPLLIERLCRLLDEINVPLELAALYEAPVQFEEYRGTSYAGIAVEIGRSVHDFISIAVSQLTDSPVDLTVPLKPKAIAKHWQSLASGVRDVIPVFDHEELLRRLENEHARASAQVTVDDRKVAQQIGSNMLQLPKAKGDSGDGNEMLSCPELAKKFGLESERLRKRLERWRLRHDDGWNEVSERKPNEPRYLFRLSAVQSIIDELRCV